MMKKTVFLSFLLVASFLSLASYSQKKINVLHKEQLIAQPNLTLLDGKGYLRATDIVKIYNLKLDWYAISKKLTFSKSNKEVILFVNNNEVIIDEVKRKMNKSPFLEKNIVMVPLELIVTRAFNKAFSYTTSWNRETKTLLISEEEEEEEINILPPSETTPLQISLQESATPYYKQPNLPYKEKPIHLERVVTSIPLHLKIRTVVIDPGHGGKDPGAIGPRGTEEKEIVLDVAKRLANLIKKRLQAKVILTRYDDTFVPLAVRTQIANEQKADLFISIHANASLSPKTKGFEVYFLSEKASDAEAEAVANMENSVIEMEEPSPKLNELTKILWSMTYNKFMNDSSLLCSLISKEVSSMRLGIENRKVKQAAFYVLRGTKMPAVLIELGFLSNKEEERKLRTRGFRKKITEAIYKGIFHYKKQLAVKR